MQTKVVKIKNMPIVSENTTKGMIPYIDLKNGLAFTNLPVRNIPITMHFHSTEVVGFGDVEVKNDKAVFTGKIKECAFLAAVNHKSGLIIAFSYDAKKDKVNKLLELALAGTQDKLIGCISKYKINEVENCDT